jgi:WD40 repeat protein
MRESRVIGKPLLFISLVLTFQICGARANAQRMRPVNRSAGSVSGVIKVPDGTVMSGATVSLTNGQTGVSRSTATNDQGVYRFNAVAPGNYTVKMSASGFGTYTTTNVIVRANENSSVNGELNVMTSVTVDAVGEAMSDLDVYSVAFSPDGRYVLTGTLRGIAVLWDAATGREIRRYQPPNVDSVHSVAFSPDGRLVLIGSGGGYVGLLETATGREVRKFEGHSGSINSVAFSTDGRYILTGSGSFAVWGADKKDNTARLWDAATGREIRKFEGHRDDAYVPGDIDAVAFSPNGRYVATSGGDGTVRLWDAANGWQIHRFGTAEDFSEGYTSVTFSPDSRSVLAGSLENIAQLWDTTTGKEVRRFEGHADNVNSVAFSPDGRYVLTGSGKDHDRGESGDYTARLWDALTGKEIRRFEGHTKRLRSVAFSPDGRFVLTGSDDKTARLWSVATGKEIRKFWFEKGIPPSP